MSSKIAAKAIQFIFFDYTEQLAIEYYDENRKIKRGVNPIKGKGQHMPVNGDRLSKMGSRHRTGRDEGSYGESTSHNHNTEEGSHRKASEKYKKHESRHERTRNSSSRHKERRQFPDYAGNQSKDLVKVDGTEDMRRKHSSGDVTREKKHRTDSHQHSHRRKHSHSTGRSNTVKGGLFRRLWRSFSRNTSQTR